MNQQHTNCLGKINFSNQIQSIKYTHKHTCIYINISININIFVCVWVWVCVGVWVQILKTKTKLRDITSFVQMERKSKSYLFNANGMLSRSA